MAEPGSDKICFVIAPIGKPDSPERERSDQVLDFIIRPAVTRFGYKAVRADEIDEPGLITTQVLQAVVDAPLVVADLTGRNPNVFYELSLRHATKKPVIQIIDQSEDIPFDISDMRTVKFSWRDLRSADRAAKEISAQVEAIENNVIEFKNPISVSTELKALSASGDMHDKGYGEIFNLLINLQSQIRRVASSVEEIDRHSPSPTTDVSVPISKSQEYLDEIYARRRVRGRSNSETIKELTERIQRRHIRESDPSDHGTG